MFLLLHRKNSPGVKTARIIYEHCQRIKVHGEKRFFMKCWTFTQWPRRMKLKKPYRQMAMKYHPDPNAGNKESERKI